MLRWLHQTAAAKKTKSKSTSKVVQAIDPNEMIGPAGYGDGHWIDITDTMGYTILFEMSVRPVPLRKLSAWSMNWMKIWT